MNTIKKHLTIVASMLLVFTLQTASATEGGEAEEFSLGAATPKSPESKEYTFPTGDFVQDPFTFTISPMVYFAAEADTSTAVVGAASARGKHVYTGTTAGGSVTKCGDKYAEPIDGEAVSGSLDLDGENGCGAASEEA